MCRHLCKAKRHEAIDLVFVLFCPFVVLVRTEHENSFRAGEIIEQKGSLLCTQPTWFDPQLINPHTSLGVIPEHS